MIPKVIAGATHWLRKPDEWKQEDGSCAALAVRVDGGVYASAWEPTPAEMALLNAGGRVVLRVLGGQPPVMLTVEEDSDDRRPAG